MHAGGVSGGGGGYGKKDPLEVRWNFLKRQIISLTLSILFITSLNLKF